jgi:XTP/dITP diphosphohydrolase
MQLVFASNNKNKIQEIQALVPPNFKILSLEDIGCFEEIPETADTIEGNAILKANYVTLNYGYPCFADDTGLEVLALNNEPGVHSARYAGEHRSDEENISKLLSNLKETDNRSARFRTAIVLIMNDQELLFEGIVEGKILETKKGTNGFGYDPVFEPEDCGKSFAELSLSEKNERSHRARAMKQLIEHLNS